MDELVNKNIRVNHICSNFDNFYLDFINTQCSQGIESRVFYFRAKERGMPSVEAPYLDIRLNYSNWDRPFFYKKEKKILTDFEKFYKNEKFDLLHAHTLFSNGYIAMRIQEKYGTPYIVAIRDMDVNLFFKYRINLKNVGLKIIDKAEKLIFISEKYRDLVFEKYIPKEKVEEYYNKSLVIPNGVNNYYLDNSYKRNYQPHKEITIITVGYVSKRKNQLKVCEAIQKSDLRNNYKVKYKIIGEVLDKNIFDKVNEYDFVEYTPYMDKELLLEEYRKSDIYIMPSLTETFGLTYIEAMTQGLPIIYSKNQGVDGYFKNGLVGFSVNSNDHNSISNSIYEIIKNYKEISGNSTKLSRKFNWNDISNEYNKIYSDIL